MNMSATREATPEEAQPPHDDRLRQGPLPQLEGDRNNKTEAYTVAMGP